MKEHKLTGLRVIKAEHKNSKEVVVTYEDFSKQTFSPAHYNRMHKDIK